MQGDPTQGTEYEAKLERERAWWRRAPTAGSGLASRLLHHPLIFDSRRVAFGYVEPKIEMAKLVRRRLGGQKAKRLLIAPCGEGGDLEVLGEFAEEAHGIDLAQVAVDRCPPHMHTRVGDILDSGYEAESFDLVASPLFFHHLLTVGFEPFLQEFHRVLRPGGGLVILEPSVWYPLNAITRPLKHLLKNPYGEVEDEGPFRPGKLVTALEQAGFVDLEVRAASFSHCSFYVPVAKAVNRACRPLLGAWPLKYFGWMTLYWATRG